MNVNEIEDTIKLIMNISEIEVTIKEHCDLLENLIKNQNEIIKSQEDLIETLKDCIQATESSRDYWIQKYYKLAEEVMKWILKQWMI